MKNKGNSLYEVLKTASRTPGADGAPGPEVPAAPHAEGGQPTLQERLAAYKAAKLAAASQPSSEPPAAAEPAPARMSSATLVLEPDPTPLPAPSVTVLPRSVPAPAPVAPRPVDEDTPAPAPSKGPGERVVKLTYNTVLFGGMVVVGLLFMTYAIGLHVGKSSVAAETAPVAVRPTPTPTRPPTPPPVVNPVPAPRKEYTIRLGEWRTSISSERVKGQMLADDANLKKALERAGHKGFEKASINRGANDIRLALYVDRFADINSETAKSALAAMKVFRWNNTTPFAQAAFEEVQPR